MIKPFAPTTSNAKRSGWFAGAGLLGALLASSCCVAPLILVLIGVSGAWIGNLTALEPYQPIFAAIALLFIALGFRQAYFRSSADCADEARCARPGSTLWIRSILWIATLLVVAALTVDWWAPYFY